MKLKKLLSLALGVIMLCGAIPTSYAQGEEEVDTTLIVRPTVMINAGTEPNYNPKFNYSAVGHILLSPNSYSDPLTNIKAGLFLKWNLPKIPDGYEVKRSYFIGKAKHSNQFSTTNGYHNGKSYIYHLDVSLDDEYIFNSDTATYPDKNLATLLPTFSNKTHKLETTFLYKGATTNYYDEVTDDTKFYNLGFSAKNYTKNLYIASNGGPVEVNTLMASRQNLTFDAASDLDYGPLVWYIEIDKLFDAEFVSPAQVAAGKAFDTAIDVNILDKRIASVVFNVNGTNYTATLLDGKWVATIPALEEGEYTVKANITDIYESKYEETQKITVATISDPIQITAVDMKDYEGKAWDIVINDFNNSNTYEATFTDGEEKKSNEIDFSNVEADGGNLAFAIFLHTTRANVALDIVTE